MKWWEQFNMIILRKNPKTFKELKLLICKEFVSQRYNFQNKRAKKTNSLESTFFYACFGEKPQIRAAADLVYPQHPCPDKRRKRNRSKKEKKSISSTIKS